ncbi:MAG: hypothetical protein DMG08_25415 [Acidobacteria bacterium]|nr:MAG: hypothetical protein DMG08_25415 [Acidobacteriota bacterium]
MKEEGIFMYRIVGGDGREYGPVSADEIARWISEGRVNAQTLTRSEESTDWKPLSTFPEFAGALHAVAPGAGLPPLPPQSPDQLAAAILARGYTVDIGSCLSRSWGLLKANFWLVAGTTLLIYVLLGGIGAGLSHLATLWLGLSLHGFAVAGGVVGSVWHMIFGGSLLGGLYWFYLRLIRGYSPDVGDAFAGFTLAFAQLTLAYIVSALLTCAGLVFCFLPGIYLAVAWIFTLPLVIDKRMDFWEAMEVSRKVVTREWWSVFALIIVAGLVGGAGILACCVGVLVTAPIGFGALVYAYEDIFGTQQPSSALRL